MEKNKEKQPGHFTDSKAMCTDVDVEISGIKRGVLPVISSNGNLSQMIARTSKRKSRSPHRK